MSQTFDLLLKGGEVVNHSGRGRADVGIIDGKTVEIGDLSQASAGEVIDCTGLTVLPGVIDSQVHFREPGMEWKEDLQSGSLCGGSNALRKKITASVVRPTASIAPAPGRCKILNMAPRITTAAPIPYILGMMVE